MNKFIKLVRVKILELFDFNKIRVAREDGVKSNLELKTILVGIMAVVYGYILYKVFLTIDLENKFLILSIGYLISSLLCLFANLFIIEPVILKSNDSEMLFSLPVSRYQILFSKLFVVYLRNIVLVGIVMIASFLSYGYFVKDLSDTFVLMGILSTLLIPVGPIIFATVVVYGNQYFKIKSNNNLLFKIGRLLVIGCFVMFLVWFFRDVRVENLNALLEMLVNKGHILYLMSFLFDSALSNENIWWFILQISSSVFFIYVYTLVISNHYLKIVSMLKGQKKKNDFVYKRKICLGSFWGFVRKELLGLFHNKFYLFNTIGMMVVFSVLLVFGLAVFNFEKFYEIENFKFYLNLYVPTLLAMLVTMSSSAIHSMSLEKKNIEMLRTMPVRMEKVVLAKWMTNVIVGSVFVFINGTAAWYYLELSKWSTLFSYLVPLVALMFVSLISVLLDYRFINTLEQDDNVILKQRVLGMIPTFLGLIIGIGPFFIPAYKKYNLLLGSYVLAMVIGMFICGLYLVVMRERLLENLNN